MSFFDFLQTFGGRLGILENASGTIAGECAKVVTRTVTLEELKTEIRSEEVRTLADLPAELTVPYERIFDAAGVRASGKWDLARLKHFLEPRSRHQRDETQKALLDALSSEGASAEDLIREATAQDQALDHFEVLVCNKVADHMTIAQHQVADLDARIHALQTERAQLAERIRQDQDKLRDWRLQKRAYERELAAALGYITDRPVISTDNDVQ